METLWQDLRYELRGLRKAPGFAAVAVLTLALGIGANTAIFSVVNSVLLRPLAYRDSGRLYLISEIVPQWEKSYPLLDANLPDFRIWQKQATSFEQIAIAESWGMNLSGLGPAEEIHGVRASANLLDTLGVTPALGRGFVAEDDEPGHDRVVILSDAFWRARFHGDPGIVGRSITLDGEPHAVVGVLPAAFQFPKEIGGPATGAAFFKPLGGPLPYERELIGEFDFAAIARLKPGVKADQALAELNIVQAQIAREAKADVDLRAAIFPLQDRVVGPARRGLLLLLAAVGAVLLIVCVNLANLFLARVPGRRREAAIRTALGATRGRLLQQLLTESLVVTLLGGVLGIAVAYAGVHALVQAAPADLPRIGEIAMDGRVLGFAFILCALTGAFFGILPAWQLAQAEPQEALKSGGTATTENRRTRRLRETLIGVEVGLSTVLLILAGLLGTSLFKLVGVDTGFATERVLAADVELPPQTYTAPAMRGNFYEQVLAGIRALPGVESAGWVSILPLTGEGSVTHIFLPGDENRPERQLMANYRVVSPSYFETMRIPLERGRRLVEEDRGRKLIVVSHNVAERLWPGKDPVGQKCIAEWAWLGPSEVVGVVGDVRTRLDRPPLPMVYTVDFWPEKAGGAPPMASIVMRSAMEPAASVSAVRGIIERVDAGVPVLALRPMTALVVKSVEARRFQLSLAGLFGGSALFLASLGIFGVVAYSVEQRRQEMGIRAAFGASANDLLGLVLRQGMTPVCIGLAAGVAATIPAGRLIESLLFGVGAFDPLTVAAVATVVIVVAAVACYLPAQRAMRIEPMAALRYQ